jgi:hypothetical protein
MSDARDRIDLLLAQEPAQRRTIGRSIRPDAARGDQTMAIVRALLSVAAFLAAYQVLRIGSLNFTLSDVALLTAILLLAGRGQLTGTPFGLFTPLWFGAVGVMLTGLFLSSLLNGDLFRWMIVAGQYMVAYLVLPMAVMSQPKWVIKRLIRWFVIGMVVLEGAGILISLTLSSAQAADLFGVGFLAGNGRLGSFVGEANWNGAMIASTVAMLVYLIHERLIPALLGIVMGMTLAWALLLCASFTGFSATMISLGLTLAVAGRRYLLRIALPAALLAGLFPMTGLPLPQVFQQRVGDALTSGDIQEAGTYTGRVRLIAKAWEMTEQTSLLGVGADEFRNYSGDQQPVHNIYLLMWTEGGILAVGGLIGMLVMLGVMILAGASRGGAETALAVSAATVFLIYTAASPHMFSRLWALPVMLALGLLYGRDDAHSAGYAPPSFLAAR